MCLYTLLNSQSMSFPSAGCIRNHLPHYKNRRSSANVLSCNYSSLLQGSCQVKILQKVKMVKGGFNQDELLSHIPLFKIMGK